MADAFEDDVALDAQAFREAMAAVAASVAVLTAEVGRDIRGVTISSLISLSVDPPLVLFALKHDSTMLGHLDRRRFGIAILAESQHRIAHHCAAGGRPPLPAAWLSARGDGAAPTVHGAAATLDVALFAKWRTGDHVVVAARVRRACVTAARPLIYHRRAY